MASADMDELLVAALIEALGRCKIDGPYPCPEAELKRRAAELVSGRVPAKGRAGALGRLLKRATLRDRGRVGRPVLCVLPGDGRLLHPLGDEELIEAVLGCRERRVYPASSAALAKHLRLSPAGRKFLQERIRAGALPEALGAVSGRTPAVTLRGEESFGRALPRKEQLELRIRLADLEAHGPLREERRLAGPAVETEWTLERFAAAFARSYAALARYERSPFVPLPRLRNALGSWPRDHFDQHLIALCRADRYQLAEHEQPARLTPEERDGSLLWGEERRAFYYVSKI